MCAPDHNMLCRENLSRAVHCCACKWKYSSKHGEWKTKGQILVPGACWKTQDYPQPVSKLPSPGARTVTSGRRRGTCSCYISTRFLPFSEQQLGDLEKRWLIYRPCQSCSCVTLLTNPLCYTRILWLSVPAGLAALVHEESARQCYGNPE